MRIIIIFFLVLTINLLAYSEELEKIHIEYAKGEASLAGNITPDKAGQQALYKAWTNAIEQACGKKISGVSSVKDGMFAGEYIQALSHGYVVNYEKIARDCDKRHKPQDDQWMWRCWIEISADVICMEGEIDPSFSVDVELDKMMYNANEELILTVTPSLDCYITVFNLGADDNVYILYPNDYQKTKLFKEGETAEIPSQTHRDMGIHLRVAPLPGHTSDVEYIKVVATKTELDMAKYTKNHNGIKTLKDGVITLGQILANIPLNQRTEDMAQYVVGGE